MRILLLGSGGREHAIALKLSQSPLCEKLFIAPGNAGTAQCGTNLPFGFNDFDAIKKACVDEKIDMVMVGPEEPLVNGITDFLISSPALKNIAVLAPARTVHNWKAAKHLQKHLWSGIIFQLLHIKSLHQQIMKKGLHI